MQVALSALRLTNAAAAEQSSLHALALQGLIPAVGAYSDRWEVQTFRAHEMVMMSCACFLCCIGGRPPGVLLLSLLSVCEPLHRRTSDHAARVEVAAFLGTLATGPPAGVQLLVACQVGCSPICGHVQQSSQALKHAGKPDGRFIVAQTCSQQGLGACAAGAGVARQPSG